MMKGIFTIFIVLLSFNSLNAYDCNEKDKTEAICDDSFGYCPVDEDGRKDCSSVRANLVCATYTDGRKETYYDGCLACADPDVKSHIPGECQPEAMSHTCTEEERDSECGFVGGGCWVNADGSEECDDSPSSPVCAEHKSDGGHATHYDGCMACSNADVVSYTSGACPHVETEEKHVCNDEERGVDYCTALTGGCWMMAPDVKKCDNQPRYPVCAELDNGEQATFWDGCFACSSNEVVSYVEGECVEAVSECSEEGPCPSATEDDPFCAIALDDSKQTIYEGCPCENARFVYPGQCARRA
jgi:hypothetical protein